MEEGKAVPLIAAGDILQGVVHVSHPNSSAIQNVFHWLVTGTGSEDSATALPLISDQLELAYGLIEPYMANLAEVTRLVFVSLQWVVDHWETLTLLGELLAPFSTFNPTDSAHILPPGVSATGMLVTGLPRRIGRKYFAPFTEVNNDLEGDATAGLVVGVANALSAYDTIVPLNAGLDAEPVVLARDGPNPNPIAYVAAGPIFAYQRRRKINRGI